MPFVDPDPPRTRPRGVGTERPSSSWGTVSNAQSTSVPIRSSHPAGVSTSGRRSSPPASSSSTDTCGSSLSRAATTHPAVPPPTTT